MVKALVFGTGHQRFVRSNRTEVVLLFGLSITPYNIQFSISIHTLVILCGVLTMLLYGFYVDFIGATKFLSIHARQALGPGRILSLDTQNTGVARSQYDFRPRKDIGWECLTRMLHYPMLNLHHVFFVVMTSSYDRMCVNHAQDKDGWNV